jgi:hypothetical protein
VRYQVVELVSPFTIVESGSGQYATSNYAIVDTNVTTAGTVPIGGRVVAVFVNPALAKAFVDDANA